MDINSVMLEIFQDLVEGFFILLFVSAVYGDKRFILKNKLKCAFFLILYATIASFATFYLPYLFHTIFITIFIVIFISYLMQKKVYSSLLVIAVLFLINMALEYIVIGCCILISGKSFSVLMDTLQWKIIFAVAVKALLLLVIFALPFNKINLSRLNFENNENRIINYLILQLTMISFAAIAFNAAIGSKINEIYYNILIIIVLLAFVALGIFDFFERVKITKILAKFEVQESQIKNMSEIINIIRKERHDYANHINTIMALCSLNKPDSIERVKNYVLQLTANVHLSSFKSFDTGNDYIDALLAIKYNYAKENNISLEVLIGEPLNNLPIPENELISIVSNLADNAFEAVVKSDAENKKVSLKTFCKDNNCCLSVSNNGTPIPKESMARIFEQGFTTKVDGKKEHGFGLFIVRQLVRKNNAELTVTSSEEATVFTVEFKRR